MLRSMRKVPPKSGSMFVKKSCTSVLILVVSYHVLTYCFLECSYQQWLVARIFPLFLLSRNAYKLQYIECPIVRSAPIPAIYGCATEQWETTQGMFHTTNLIHRPSSLHYRCNNLMCMYMFDMSCIMTCTMRHRLSSGFNGSLPRRPCVTTSALGITISMACFLA